MTLSKDKILHLLLRLELSDPEQHLKKRELFPCYGCFRVLPPSAFLDFRDMPAFNIGGRCAQERLCGTTDTGSSFEVVMGMELVRESIEEWYEMRPYVLPKLPALRDAFGLCGGLRWYFKRRHAALVAEKTRLKWQETNRNLRPRRLK